MAVEGKSRLKPNFTTKRKKLEQDLEHVTQEMYRKNLELVETNRTLSLLRAIDAIVLESQDTLELLSHQITKAIADNSNFTSVAIFSKLPSRSDLVLVGRTFPKLSTTDESPETPAAEPAKTEVETAPDKSDRGVIAGKEGKVIAPDVTPPHTPTTKAEEPKIPDIMLDTDDAWFETQERILKLHVGGEHAHQRTLGLTQARISELFDTPLKGLYLIKLRARQQLVGVMAIGFGNTLSKIPEDDITLLDRLSEAVGVAIDNRLLYEENQLVLKKLQKTNEKLKALDEAKDEFISMASHQLRTPLTSVKGYVSMVIEGDAGKVSKQQHDLLGQAFASSQRMVYLIADLLNVSRLRTGKFVIENKPTQLADVVETELSQLQEAAKSKKQTLKYTKPKNFPMLSMDETKIRQVVMNFTDNALYYTQAGGHITVNLEDKGSTIEFTVVDDGIGVPKEEQHKMFTKFYRAGNARKARPDGTGLGLFMAKKVIVAQGGAVIFKSTEGKGSTFGFSFAKSKLRIPANAKSVPKRTPADVTSADVSIQPPAEVKTAAASVASEPEKAPENVEPAPTAKKPTKPANK